MSAKFGGGVDEVGLLKFSKVVKSKLANIEIRRAVIFFCLWFLKTNM